MKRYWIASIVCLSFAVAPAFAAGLLRPAGGSLPELEIEEHRVNIVINNGFAITEVDQTFRNPHDRQLEGTFEYPLPPNASASYYAMFLTGEQRETPEFFPRRELADLKISMVGLPYIAGDKYPSELSGGMRKRAGLARALALDPDIVFLDDLPQARHGAQARKATGAKIERAVVVRAVAALGRDGLAALQRLGQGRQAPVDTAGHATVAHVGVHRVGEVDRRRARGKRDQAALRREAEDLVVEQLELGVFEEFLRVVAVEKRFDQAAQPHVGVDVLGLDDLHAFVHDLLLDDLLTGQKQFIARVDPRTKASVGREMNASTRICVWPSSNRIVVTPSQVIVT